MKAFDPEGKQGPSKPLPDAVTLLEPKAEAPIETRSEHKGEPVAVAQAQQPQEEAQPEQAAEAAF